MIDNSNDNSNTDIAHILANQSTANNDYTEQPSQIKENLLQRLAIVNFCSVTNKQAELEAFLTVNNIQFLLGTESHLDESITNSEIFPSHYYVYRKDRNIHGGGVFILVEESIPSSQVIVETPCEIVWVQLHTSTHRKVILGSFYNPPNSPANIWDELSLCVQQIQEQFPDAILLLGGDFNCPGIEWPTGSLTDSYLPVNVRESLIAFAQDFFLEQIITEPTRGKNILDLCFTSHPSYIHQSTTVPGLSDHEAIIIDILNCIPSNKNLKKKVYCYNKADWISLHEKVASISNDYLQLNETSSRSVCENWNYFHKNLMQAVEAHIPIN